VNLTYVGAMAVGADKLKACFTDSADPRAMLQGSDRKHGTIPEQLGVQRGCGFPA
jgi:hypothetical protein